MGADDWSSNAQTISNPHTRSLGLDYPEGQYNTLEMLPNENNYAIQDDLQGLRPSVLTIVEGDKVHDDDMFQARKAASEQQRSELKEKQRQRRFGTYNGVVVRCLLNIWGVIMFLRMGWVVGHAGVWHSTLIIGIALLNSILTSLSMSAICTNGEVSGGGAYFLISRTLGPAFGGSIGLIFSVANMVAASLYVVGFAETLVGTFHSDDFHLVGDGSWDLRIYAIIALFLLFGLCLVGVGWVVKIDVFQLCLLITGICMFFLGTFINSSDADIGFTGFSSTTFSDNWGPAYKDGESMVSVFAVFFPAVTGMMAGANISGDLKNPQVSIPRGTLISVVLSISVYMIIAWVLAATCLRVAPDGGLYDDSLLMITISLWKPIVVAGVFASTLSSALASLVGAPRILKAVCEDKLIPALNFFAVGRESDNEPVRAYVLTLVVSFCIILIGDLNAIAELITNFFLFNRALVNYACFSMAISRSPGKLISIGT